MKITVTNNQADLFLSPLKVRKIVRCILQDLLKIPCSEVAIHFVDKKEISKLHKKFFNDPTITDCITFPIDGPDEENGILGEVFVCPYVAIKYAKENNLDPYQETTLYIIHGLLHLLGFDDIKEKDRKVMRQQEKKLMDHLSEKKISLHKVVKNT